MNKFNKSKNFIVSSVGDLEFNMASYELDMELSANAESVKYTNAPGAYRINKDTNRAERIETFLDKKETIRKSLEHFQGVEHRLENVLTINKVKYINDSKATNVNATYYALESMESPTVWIVGGVDKGNDYADLTKVVNKRVKAIICLGLNNLKIMDHFENAVEYIVEVKSMDEAVNAAYKISSSGDCVLLSPACASFDLFDDFEDRGRQFKTAVRKL